MAKLIQLDFFEESEISVLKAEIAELKAAMDRQRKSQFAKIGECKKEIIEIKAEFQDLKKAICLYTKV